MSRCLQEAHITEWMSKRRATLIQKDLRKGTASNNYRPITRLPMMCKILTIKIREEIYFSLTSRRLFPEEQRGCLKGSRDTGELLYIDQHILNENKTRRKNPGYGLDWQQKGIFYGLTKLDNKLSQNVQNVRWVHKLYRENHENLESAIDSRREKLSRNKDSKRYIPRRFTVTFTIYNCDDATQPHTQKMYSRIQTY